MFSFQKNVPIVWCGVQFRIIPRRFGDLIAEAIKKKFPKVGATGAQSRVTNGFNEGRIRARCRLRDKVLRRRREPNASPVWELLLRNELMRQADFANIMDLPVPFHETDQEIIRFCSIYAKEIGIKYNVSDS